VAILTWLSFAFAAMLVFVLGVRLVAIMRLLRLIDTTVRDVHRTRLSIAEHAGSLDGQLSAVRDATASAAGHFTTAVAAVHRRQQTIGEVP
jgi:hypothetical protein